jgi:hypothetical protein
MTPGGGATKSRLMARLPRGTALCTRGSFAIVTRAFAKSLNGGSMAKQHHSSGDSSTGGSMDITDHVKTWLAFWSAAKWSSAALIVLAVLLFIFRTHNG